MGKRGVGVVKISFGRLDTGSIALEGRASLANQYIPYPSRGLVSGGSAKT